MMYSAFPMYSLIISHFVALQDQLKIHVNAVTYIMMYISNFRKKLSVVRNWKWYEIAPIPTRSGPPTQWRKEETEGK